MNILILNVHSALNLGDDGIMQATLTQLEQAYPTARITVAANDPQSWRKYQQIEVVSSLCNWVADCRLGRWRQGLVRMPIVLVLLLALAVGYRFAHIGLQLGSGEQRKLLSAYYQADLVLSCGGGNFYAHRPSSPAFFWALVTLAFAIVLGKPVAMLPQSVGPIEGRLQRTLARAVFSRVPVIMLREPISLAFVRDDLNIERDRLHLLPDLAFGLPLLPGAPTEPQQPQRSNMRIGFTVIDRGSQHKGFARQDIYERSLLQVLERVAREYGAVLHLFVQCYGPSPDQDDRLVSRRIYERLCRQLSTISLYDEFQDAVAIQQAMAKMDLVIASRMHTGIFALTNGTPIVLIGYQPKALGMIAAFDLEAYHCTIDSVTPEALSLLADRALENRTHLQRQITQRVSEMRPLLESWPGLLPK
jgi:colanic acid/amylovoran biosynthesis protein